MPASYPNAVKTYTTKSDGAGNRIQADHVNALQDEVTAIEDGLLNGTAPVNSSRITAPAIQVTDSTITTLTATNLVSGGGRLVLPSSGGSTGQVLTIVSTSGSTQTVEWRTPSASAISVVAWARFTSAPAIVGGSNISSVTSPNSTSMRFAFSTSLGSSVYAVAGQTVATNPSGVRVLSQESTGFLLGMDGLGDGSVIVVK